MQQFLRRMLTAFVFSMKGLRIVFVALAFLEMSATAKAATLTPTFTVDPNPINAGETSTLRLILLVEPFGTTVVPFIDPTSTVNLTSGNGVTASFTPTWVSQAGSWLADVSLTTLYPNPGAFGVSYSYSVVAALCPIGDCPLPAQQTFTGLSATFLTVNPVATPNPVPLPAALPLFATGLGVLGLLGWRRKRKTGATVRR